MRGLWINHEKDVITRKSCEEFESHEKKKVCVWVVLRSPA